MHEKTKDLTQVFVQYVEKSIDKVDKKLKVALQK